MATLSGDLPCGPGGLPRAAARVAATALAILALLGLGQRPAEAGSGSPARVLSALSPARATVASPAHRRIRLVTSRARAPDSPPGGMAAAIEVVISAVAVVLAAGLLISRRRGRPRTRRWHRSAGVQAPWRRGRHRNGRSRAAEASADDAYWQWLHSIAGDDLSWPGAADASGSRSREPADSPRPAFSGEATQGLSAASRPRAPLRAAESAHQLTEHFRMDYGESVIAHSARLAEQLLSDAEAQASGIIEGAHNLAASIREEAEREAAARRAAITISAELCLIAAYIAENVTSLPKPAAPPAERPTAHPVARPAEKSVVRPASRSRQDKAMRVTVGAFAAMFLFAAAAGSTEIALHGFAFFVFRSAGTGATPNNGIPENQGPGQSDAPASHHQITHYHLR